jgi:ATPase
MTESDLARPVIEIRNFADNQLEHEIYTFGEENVIVPVLKKIKKVGIEKLAEDKIRDFFKKFDPRVEVEILSDNRAKVLVDKHSMASIIGKGGSNINDIEKLLKIHIDVVEKNSYRDTDSLSNLPFSFSESKTAILLTVNKEFSFMHADIYVNEDFITSVKIGKKGEILIPKRSEASRNIMKFAASQKDIQIFIKDF